MSIIPNIVKTINAQGTKIFEYDTKKNPYINFKGLNNLYSFDNFSEIAKVCSQNNIKKMIWDNDTFNYTIDYNETLNPIKIRSDKRNYIESFKYK